jgi:hypothetical protein
MKINDEQSRNNANRVIQKNKKKFKIRLYRHVKMNLGSTGILSCAANADARLHDSNAASDSVTALIGTLGYMQL